MLTYKKKIQMFLHYQTIPGLCSAFTEIQELLFKCVIPNLA